MEYFDVVDEAGRPTGETVSRQEAHAKGIRHRTVHIWIVRRREGKTEVLLQKRSMEKDSYPGFFDTSSAGHISAGEEPLPSALREMEEELGICASPEQLAPAGMFRIQFNETFHEHVFRDNEVVHVYVYRGPVDMVGLRLQPSEVDEVRWFDLEDVSEKIRQAGSRFCVPEAGLEVLKTWLREHPEDD